MYAAVVCAAAAYWALPYRVGIILGDSMAPTFHTGSPYLMKQVRAGADDISRGDVVVFRREGRTYVKRVLGLPGDQFYILPRGIVPTRDLLVSTDALPRLQKVAQIFRTPGLAPVLRKVPSEHVYVVGDNLENSEDSRWFGFVELDSIEGLVEEVPASPRPEFTHLARKVWGV